MGIGGLVEHDESGVHRDRPTRGLHVDRVGMPPEVIRGFVDHDLVVLMEGPCGTQAGNATADDCDSLSHAACSEQGLASDEKSPP